MILRYVLDTHALIWHLEGNIKLSTAVRTLMSDPKQQFYLPSIALAEAVWAVQKGRTGITSVQDLLGKIHSVYRMTVVPTGLSVIEKSVGLHGIIEMHDRLIAATCVVLTDGMHEGILVTCDVNITASGQVKVFW